MLMLWIMVHRSSAAVGVSMTGIDSTPSSLRPTGLASAFSARFLKTTEFLALADFVPASAVVVTEACLVILSPALLTTVAITV